MMKRIKVAAAAVGIACATQGIAAIDNGATGNGELFLSVWDQVNGRSYTRDLGVSLVDFLPGSRVTEHGYLQTWRADAGWMQFVTGLPPAVVGNMRWDVVALDTVTRQRYLTTAAGNVPNLLNFTITQFNTVASHVNAVNLRGQAQNPGDPAYAANNVAADNWVIANSTDGAAYFGTASKGEQWGGKAVGPAFFVSTSLIDQPMDFWLIEQTASGSVQPGIVDNFDAGNLRSYFQFGSNGDLTFRTVPEPGSLGLALAGGLGIAALRRRRKSA